MIPVPYEMRRQRIVLRPVAEEAPEDLKSTVEAEASTPDQPESASPRAEEVDDKDVPGIEAIFKEIEAFFHDRTLFLEFCVIQGHSDMQTSERRSTMDLREFLTLMRSVGVMIDSPGPPTNSGLLKTANRLSKTAATRAFRDVCAAEEASQRKQMNGMNRTLVAISELSFGMYCEAASTIVSHLTKGTPNHTSATLSKVADSLSKVVKSTSGLKMERIEQARRSKRAKMRALETSPLKKAMPKELEPYREERRKLLFSNLPAGFHNPDAPQIPEGDKQEIDEQDKQASGDPMLEKVEHFLFDRNLFLQYCMIPGHSAVQSGARQKTMDMKEFLYMAHEVGALKPSELGRGDIKSVGRKAEYGEGQIPKIEGLEGNRKQLTKRQATSCFRAAMAQATSQSLLAAGELSFDLYKIAAGLMAKVYVHGESEQEDGSNKKSGRSSCPPAIPAAPPAHSNKEIYTKILEALPRLRPRGENKTLDEVEDLLLDPEVFERFCVIEGHSSLQTGSRRSTMDQYEWLRCLSDLGLMPAEELKENRVLDPFLKQKDKKKPPPVYPTVVAKIEERISKDTAVNIFRKALGKAAAKHGMPVGELNFRRYCIAAQKAASLLVLGEEQSKESHAQAASPNLRTVVKRGGGLTGMNRKVKELPEWNERFSIPSARARPIDRLKERPPSKVSFHISSDVAHQPSVERMLTRKCMELACEGDRAMLREEFCTRFSHRDAYQHLDQPAADSPAAATSEPEAAKTRDGSLHSAVVDSLQTAGLIPEFYSRESILELLAEAPQDSPAHAAVKPKTPKSVSFGGHSAAHSPDQAHRSNQGTDGAQAEATRRAQYRECLDRVVSRMDLEPLESFLQSSHGWCQAHSSTFDLGEDSRESSKKAMQKRQIPPTPWTQAHPTAAHRPRTSVRVMMLNQKELREQVNA